MRNKIIFLTLCLLITVTSLGSLSYAKNIFTLEDALSRVSYHSDVEAWSDSITNVDKTIKSITDKHGISLDVGGNILSYSYDVKGETHGVSTGQTLSISKSNLNGTTLGANYSPKWSYSTDPKTGSATSSTWGLSLSQTIWPSPKLSSDQISLSIAAKHKNALQSQSDYILANARFKIEELYHKAQLAQEKVQFSQQNLHNAEKALEIIIRKKAMGEAGEFELIGAEIAVLRGKRELEVSLKASETARISLFDAIDLEGDFVLEPLNFYETPKSNVDIDFSELTSNLANHPLVQHYKVDLEKANLDLRATMAAEKPRADLSINFTNNKTFVASVNIGHSILDKNQQATTLESREEALENLEKAYEKAIEKLRDQVKDAEEDLQKLEQDLEISNLTVRQATLEKRAAEERYAKGMIEQTALEGAETKLRQAQLDFYELSFIYDLTLRRLSMGILGDLPLTGGSR